MSPRLTWGLQGVILSFLCALLVFYVSENLSLRQRDKERSIEMQEAIYAGRAFYYAPDNPVYTAQLYNRQMFPTSLHMLERHAGVKRETAFFLLNLGFEVLCFTGLYVLVTGVFRGAFRTVLTAQALLALGFLATFTYGYKHSTEHLDAFFFIVLSGLALARWRASFLAVVILASCNRESAVFAGVLWFFLWKKSGMREVLFSVCVCLAAIAAVVGMRYASAGNILGKDSFALPFVYQQLWFGSIPEKFFSLWENIRYPFSWIYMVAAMFVPGMLWAWSLRGRFDSMERSLIQANLCLFGLTCALGMVDEPRIFVPSLALLLVTAARAESRICVDQGCC
jgi:hypothetical protein